MNAADARNITEIALAKKLHVKETLTFIDKRIEEAADDAKFRIWIEIKTDYDPNSPLCRANLNQVRKQLKSRGYFLLSKEFEDDGEDEDSPSIWKLSVAWGDYPPQG